MENYKRILGYDNYEINPESIIRNCKTKRILKQRIHKNTGYYQINLHVDGNSKTVNVHRLMGITYMDNPNNLYIIDHIDGNRKNNHLSNLRWTTVKENLLNRVPKFEFGLKFCPKSNKWFVYNNSNEPELSVFEKIEDAVDELKSFFCIYN